MSLKSFHLFFIVAAVLCSIGLSVWAYVQTTVTPGANFIVMALASGGLAVALSIYGIWFAVKKARHIIV